MTVFQFSNVLNSWRTKLMHKQINELQSTLLYTSQNIIITNTGMKCSMHTGWE